MKRLLLLLFAIPAAAAAEERILEFESDIVVYADGWIQVTESITVNAEGERIRRGIYRDFPTEYRDRYGNEQVVDFRPLAVLRNGEPEDWHAESYRNGVRTYFGHRDRFIDPGVHVYEFRYRASRMLGFFESHDELYWNVTGFDWAFPIDEARARVSLDFDARPSSVEAYTGAYGEQGQDYRARIDADGRALFEATSPLSPVNGLTIVVTWPKGHVEEPGALQRAQWLFTDNANLLVAAAGLIALLSYYIPVWRRFGRDPDEGVLVTRYVPPEGYSPASLRYVRQMYYDDKVMTAAIVNLAVKGYLRINKVSSDYSLYKLEPGAAAPPLAPGERELYRALFKNGERVVLEKDNHALLGRARADHRLSLKADYKHRYFQTNGALNVPAIVIAIGATIGALAVGSGPTPLVLATIVAMFLVMVFFAILMKRPTMRGRKLLDEMLGFKDYLEVAEKDELNLRNPPQKTPELFEAYLPYALALGVEQQWAEKFSAVLASIHGPDGRPYQPAWYSGSFNPARLSSTTGKLSRGLGTAISSSVTPPGSSSGSGGGGFSGGGGGGGGGGGW